MHYSEERLQNLAFQIHDKLYMNADVDYPNSEQTLAKLKVIMIEYFSVDDRIDKIVVAKIHSLKKFIPEGSDEWDILYQKYREQERRKHK